MSSADMSIGQGGTFGNGPAGVNAYDTSPSGLGMNPTYLAPGATATASVSGSSGSVVALVSFPPSSPTDGQTVILELPSTYDPVGGKKIRWAFAYNVSDAVWNFIGGPPLYAEVLTSEATGSSGSYIDLATVGPSVLIPRPGDYSITVGAYEQSNSNTAGVYMAYAGASLSASDADAAASSIVVVGSNSYASVARTREKTALTAGTLTAKYKSLTNATYAFSDRFLSVVPVRIT